MLTLTKIGKAFAKGDAVSMADLDETVGRFAERIGVAFDEPLFAGARQHRVRVSIGAAVFPAGGRTADDLLSNSGGPRLANVARNITSLVKVTSAQATSAPSVAGAVTSSSLATGVTVNTTSSR